METRTLLLTIRYDGAKFAGWQVQKNAVAVMQVVQDAMEKVLKERPDIKGCSRTDSGVHALNYCMSFQTRNAIPNRGMILGMNANLPNSIAVIDCIEVDNDFHARYRALAKKYIYKVHTAATRDPFFDERVWHVIGPLDAQLLESQGQFFLGEHDFAAFTNTGSPTSDTMRTIYSFDAQKEGDIITLSVCGNGFLYNMVRIMMGTVLNIAQGILPKDSIPNIIESKDRKKAGVTAPACGLYLDKVFYDESFNKKGGI